MCKHLLKDNYNSYHCVTVWECLRGRLLLISWMLLIRNWFKPNKHEANQWSCWIDCDWDSVFTFTVWSSIITAAHLKKSSHSFMWFFNEEDVSRSALCLDEEYCLKLHTVYCKYSTVSSAALAYIKCWGITRQALTICVHISTELWIDSSDVSLINLNILTSAVKRLLSHSEPVSLELALSFSCFSSAFK